MIDATRIAQNYIAVWNETDPSHRNALLAQGWADDAVYVDPMAYGKGRDQISSLIAAVHDRFPGFRFALESKVDAYDDKVRFSWTLGPDSEPDMIKGTDFGIIEYGRFKTVTGFLDKVPADV